jgi:hypothetical protein
MDHYTIITLIIIPLLDKPVKWLFTCSLLCVCVFFFPFFFFLYYFLPALLLAWATWNVEVSFPCILAVQGGPGLLSDRCQPLLGPSLGWFSACGWGRGGKLLCCPITTFLASDWNIVITR